MRFVPGKVYQSTATPLKFLCVTEGKRFSSSARRRMYYIVLRHSDEVTGIDGKIHPWDYGPDEPAQYLEVKE